MILTLRRNGVFRATWTGSQNMCGTPRHNDGGEESRLYNYACELTAPSSSLDKRGFVVDNLQVNEYFQTKYAMPREPMSCEQMALEAVRDLRKAVKHPLRVQVAISPMLNASVSAEWTAAKEVWDLYTGV